MPLRRRALTHEQKGERRDTIVAAAARLFAASRYDHVTMAGIARAAGVAKGTLYVYFRTKEELFLAYAETEVGAFFADLHARLERATDARGPVAVVGAVGEAIGRRPEMMRLVVLLHLVLESNTAFERALAFRRALVPMLQRTGGAVERHLPFLEPGGGARLLLTIHAMALGFQQLADPSPVIREVERQPGMELFAFDFERALLGSVGAMLVGMEAQAAASSRARSR
jgi:AcrR family transcriptional regulator